MTSSAFFSFFLVQRRTSFIFSSCSSHFSPLKRRKEGRDNGKFLLIFPLPKKKIERKKRGNHKKNGRKETKRKKKEEEKKNSIILNKKIEGREKEENDPFFFPFLLLQNERKWKKRGKKIRIHKAMKKKKTLSITGMNKV